MGFEEREEKRNVSEKSAELPTKEGIQIKTIQELFEGYEGGPFKTELVDFGEPVGEEVW